MNAATAPIANVERKKRDPRTGLKMSASLATVFTILGHTVFGFEQPLSQVFVALGNRLLLRVAFRMGRCAGQRLPARPTPAAAFAKLVDFLLAPHMTSITLSFLLYFGERLWIMALTVALAIGSKHVLRVRVNGRLQHFMNPSNFGIAIVLDRLSMDRCPAVELHHRHSSVRGTGWCRLRS